LSRLGPDAAAADGSSRAVFLDRDGVLIELVLDPRHGTYESPYRSPDVSLAAGAAEALGRLQDAGFRLVVASNQPAAAKGTVNAAALQAVHDRVVELLAAEGIELDAWRYCFHHPHGVVPELSGECACRKPEAGLLLNAASELGLDLAASWMVGDSDSDVEAGRRAGCRTVLIEHPGSAHRRSGSVRPDLHASDLRDAAAMLG